MTVLGLFLNREVRTGGHKRYLELLEGLAGREEMRVVALMNRAQPLRPAGVEVLELDAESAPAALPKSLSYRAAALAALDRIAAAAPKVDWIAVFGETHLAAAEALKRRLGARILYSHRSNAVRESLISLAENRRLPHRLPGILLSLAKSRYYEGAASRCADLLVFQSPYDRDDFLSRVGSARGRSVVVRGNIGEPRFAAAYADANRSSGVSTVLFIGTFGERKGIKYFMEAASLLCRAGLDLRFRIVGFGARRAHWEEYARKEGIADRVSFLGRLSDPFPVLAEADLLVVPSLFDSYPNTVLEALHAGTPVIASAVGGIPDMLRRDELLFPPRDGRAIAERVERCVRDGEFYRHLKRLCAERKADFLFDWNGAFLELMKNPPKEQI